MRRLILGLAAAVAVAGPMALASPAHAERKGERHEQRWERREEHWEGGPGRGRSGPPPGQLRKWEQGRHNGYYYNNRWFYGPPPRAYYGDPHFRPGFSAWHRGAYLPPSYRGYVVEDYYRYRLRPPPRGYAWYRVGDDFMLTAIGSGLIFDIIED